MEVWIVQVTDWDAGEISIWAIYSNLDSALACAKELKEDKSLDVTTDVFTMHVND